MFQRGTNYNKQIISIYSNPIKQTIIPRHLAPTLLPSNLMGESAVLAEKEQYCHVAYHVVLGCPGAPHADSS